MDEDSDYCDEPMDSMFDNDLAFPELAGEEAEIDARMAQVEREEQEQLRAAGLRVDRRTGSYIRQ